MFRPLFGHHQATTKHKRYDKCDYRKRRWCGPTWTDWQTAVKAMKHGRTIRKYRNRHERDSNQVHILPLGTIRAHYCNTDYFFMPLSNEFVLVCSHSFCMKSDNPKVMGNIIFRKWGKASISIGYICTFPSNSGINPSYASFHVTINKTCANRRAVFQKWDITVEQWRIALVVLKLAGRARSGWTRIQTHTFTLPV
jgi:hypothetical protein